MSRRKPKKRDKRRQGKRRAVQKAARGRATQKLPHQQVIVAPPSDGVKMSEVLEEFVRPYSQVVETEDAYRKLLTLAMLAWNVTLVPEKERLSTLDSLVATLPEEVREEAREIIQDLIKRKESFFAQHRRAIIDFEVADTPEGWHLSVLSTAGPI